MSSIYELDGAYIQPYNHEERLNYIANVCAQNVLEAHGYSHFTYSNMIGLIRDYAELYVNTLCKANPDLDEEAISSKHDDLTGAELQKSMLIDTAVSLIKCFPNMKKDVLEEIEHAVWHSICHHFQEAA